MLGYTLKKKLLPENDEWDDIFTIEIAISECGYNTFHFAVLREAGKWNILIEHHL